MTEEEIKDGAFSSDAEFDDEEIDTDSSSDADAKVAEDDVFDIEFFKCYSALKKKDSKIYNKDTKFFEEDQSGSEDETKGHDGDGITVESKKTKAPRMTLLDHQLKLQADEEDEPLLAQKHKIDLTQEVSKSYYEKELQEIKESIERVNEQIDSESDDDFLKVKDSESGSSNIKSKGKIEVLLDKIEKDDDEDISHLKKIWSNPEELSEEDRFLRDYILNKRYIPSTQDESDDDGKFFSKNLENLPDAESDQEEDIAKKNRASHHSDEKDFDQLKRIPRNATKTIRDLKEKREKKEKRLKKLEKEKKKKKAIMNEDCEDIVGDMPTKFHYRETEPNDYGLSAEELLMATDEELDKWVSLKDTISYRTPEEEQRIKRKYDKKRDDIELKKKIFKSIYGDPEEADNSAAAMSNDEVNTKPTSKKSRKRKRKSNPNDSITPEEEPKENSKDETPKQSTAKRKKKHKRGLNHKKFAQAGVAPDRLLAYGISKTKLKKNKLL